MAEVASAQADSLLRMAYSKPWLHVILSGVDRREITSETGAQLGSERYLGEESARLRFLRDGKLERAHTASLEGSTR